MLQSGAIKPLQEQRAQRDGAIKWAPVRPQMEEKNVENIMEIWHLCLLCVLISGMVQSPHRTDLMFWSAAIFVSSVTYPYPNLTRQWTLKSHACSLRLYLLNRCPLHFAFIKLSVFLLRFFYACFQFAHKNRWMETHHPWFPLCYFLLKLFQHLQSRWQLLHTQRCVHLTVCKRRASSISSLSFMDLVVD